MFLCVLFDVLSLLSCNDISFVPLLARKYSPPPPTIIAPVVVAKMRRLSCKTFSATGSDKRWLYSQAISLWNQIPKTPGGGETPHMKGVGVLVGNFELN